MENQEKRRLETPMKYAEAVDHFGMPVFEDLNRPTDEQMTALAQRFGFVLTTGGFEYGTANMDDPAIRAVSQLLRAAQTARSAKQQSPDYGKV